MDTGPVTDTAPESQNWRLRPEIAALTQGIVVTGFAKLPEGHALLLQLPDNATGAWLEALETVIPITSASRTTLAQEGQPQAAAIAFSATGLARMKMPDTAMASFSRPFREGMFQEDRLRRLGDRRGGKWLDTVIDGGPIWSANTPLREAVGTVGAYDVAHGTPEEFNGTRLTVDAVVFLYAASEEAADRLASDVEGALQQHGVTVVRRLDLQLDVEHSGISREHFGFADGISQPRPFDEGGAVQSASGAITEKDPVQGVPLGEIVIGYPNGHRERAPGPVVPGEAFGRGSARPEDMGLVPHTEAEGFYDFGLNGSYVVVRELRQDVAQFWKSMDANAQAIRERDPEGSAKVTAEWIAERVVGRSRDGHLLCPAGYLRPDPSGMPNSSHLFRADDQHGIGCPIGSHVRRSNPRDSLAPSVEEGPGLLASTNNHRILRRGRKFGRKFADDGKDVGGEMGLLFVCLNTDIARQFEFVQQTWLLNANFGTLKDEVDPLVGPNGRMTIPGEPLRRALNVETFVNLVGGDYFFLPSLPALRYLAAL